jgi:hypothetical protein
MQGQPPTLHREQRRRGEEEKRRKGAEGKSGESIAFAPFLGSGGWVIPNS